MCAKFVRSQQGQVQSSGTDRRFAEEAKPRLYTVLYKQSVAKNCLIVSSSLLLEERMQCCMLE